MNPEPKSPLSSKTVWGLVTVVVSYILTVIGLDPDMANFLADGIQLHDVTAIATLIGAVVIYIGRKRAEAPLKGLWESLTGKEKS